MSAAPAILDAATGNHRDRFRGRPPLPGPGRRLQTVGSVG